MTIDDFGWQEYLKTHTIPEQLDPFSIGRVGIENKTDYLLYTNFEELTGVVRGKLLQNPESLPKVGDWVVVQKLPNEDKAVIEKVLPRKSVVSRNLEKGGVQIQVVNVDTLFVVQSLDQDFSIARIERYIVTATAAHADAVIVLNKSDKVDNPSQLEQQVRESIPNRKIVVTSTKTGAGIPELLSLLTPNLTVAFVGSSGVGKSSLINYLQNSNLHKTQETREKDDKGRHTTTRREMSRLPSGAILIDTPGLRELGVEASAEDIDSNFEDIESLSFSCKFRDCDHDHSQGCALLAAIETGELLERRYKSYMKLQKEIEREDNKDNYVYKSERKKRDKTIHKALRQVYSTRKKYE